MVKAEGRSIWNKATGSDRSSASSKSASTTNPSSPTRRLKNGGKRRRRICYKEGCTLCPSFGYEGSVAVSCSRHKKEGMQNLTARRCQHVGCSTAANFGIPGNKPKFCLPHSTEGMVNRTKPRGEEGMRMKASRISRCTTKASNNAYDGNNTNKKESGMLEAAAAVYAQGSEGSAGVGNCLVSAGDDTIMFVGDAGKRFEINEGDHYGAWSPIALREVTSRDFKGGVASVVNGSPVPSMELTSEGDKSNAITFHKRTSSSMPVWISTSPWESVDLCRTASAAFVSRGDGLDGPSVGGADEKPPGGIIGVANGKNGRHVRSGNVDEDHGPAIVPREPYRHDEFIVVPCVETDGFEKHLPSNGRDVPGGVPDGMGNENALFDQSFAGDVGNSGDIMNGGGSSFFMDELNALDDEDEMDSDMGFQIGATLEEILGVERDDNVTEDFHSKGCNDEEVSLGKCFDPSDNTSSMRSSAGLTPTPATSQGTPSAPGTPMVPDALISPKPPVEQVPWNGLEGKDVAMSELEWEPTAEEQELASACDVIRYIIYHDHDNLGEGDGVTHEESTDGGNGGMGVGEACVSPSQKRHRCSLEDNDQHTPLPTLNRSIEHGDMDPVPSGNFSLPSGSQHSTALSSPLSVGFGLTIATPLTHEDQINMEGDVSIAGGMPRSSSGVMGGSEQGDGGDTGLDNRNMTSGSEEHVCLGQPGFVGASSSLPVHVAMSN